MLIAYFSKHIWNQKYCTSSYNQLGVQSSLSSREQVSKLFSLFSLSSPTARLGTCVKRVARKCTNFRTLMIYPSKKGLHLTDQMPFSENEYNSVAKSMYEYYTVFISTTYFVQENWRVSVYILKNPSHFQHYYMNNNLTQLPELCNLCGRLCLVQGKHCISGGLQPCSLQWIKSFWKLHNTPYNSC
jgi:hypothetical protein